MPLVSVGFLIRLALSPLLSASHSLLVFALLYVRVFRQDWNFPTKEKGMPWLSKIKFYYRDP